MTLIFRCALIPALLFVSAAPILGEYQKAIYPQTPSSVKSITVAAPKQATLGQQIKINVKIDSARPITESRRAFVYLNRGDITWQAITFDPQPAPQSWKQGVNALNGVSISIPGNIPPGDYSIVVGVYKEKAKGSTSIKITGQQPSRPAKIITHGQMIDKFGVPHEWHINDAHTLIWDGKSWMPAGGMFVYSRDWNVVKAQLDLLKRYGVLDIYLHLGVNQPYPWKTYSDDDYKFFQQTIDYMDDLGFRYGVEFQALEAKGPGYYYPGNGPRVEVTGSGTVQANQDKTLDGDFVVFDLDTSTVVQTGKARVIDGKKLEADVKTPKTGRYKVVFGLRREAPDSYTMYWWDDKYTNYVDVVRKHYSKVNMGPGFRFLVDPLWNEMNANRDFLPSAVSYITQQAQWLSKRYGTIDKLNAAWRPEGGFPPGAKFKSFEQAASVMPLDRLRTPDEKRELQWVMDRASGELFSMDLATSQYNYDVQEFLGRSLQYYVNDIADQFKKIYDVPVIYKGFSDIDFWHINDTGTPYGHDGLGMESYGNGEPMMLFMSAHLFGELEQATKTTWIIVTETGQGNHMDNSPSRNKAPGYTSRLGHMYANFNALLSGGAKGIFQFNMIPGDGTQDPWTDALFTDARQLEWLGTYNNILENADKLASYKPKVYFRFPGMYNPNSMNLISEPAGDYYNFGGWWWREPIERSANDIWILPSFSLRPNAPMFIVNLEKQPATERHRDELVKAINDGARITMIGYRKDLGAIPEIDRYYTPHYAEDADGRIFQILKPTASSRVLGRSAKGDVWNLIDGNLQINSKEVFGQHGYRPDGLAVGPEKSIEPYYGVFNDLLDVKLLDLDNDLYGLSYKDKGVPVTVIGLTEGKFERQISFDISKAHSAKATYPNGEPAGVTKPGRLIVNLSPADTRLLKVDQWPARDKNPWVRQGIVQDTMNAKDAVVIRGLPKANSVPRESANAVIRKADKEKNALPAYARAAFGKVIAKAEAALKSNDFAGAIDTMKHAGDKYFSATTPYVWIEAENRASSNFNYSRMGAIPTLSGAAFLGLETAVSPPSDTGWYARYNFSVPQDGVYQLWLRENYLAYSSPCAWRIDNEKWNQASNLLVPRDTEVVALYNAVEDTRQVFAWYHYGEASLGKGQHTLTLRVDRPRGKGLAVTMSDDRQFAKLIDCILLTARGFEPDGKNKPRYLVDEIEQPMENLIKDPSFEFRPNPDIKEPAGWTRSEDSEGILWQDAGWGSYNVMPGIEVNLGQRYAYAGQRNLTIKPGEKPRFWQSKPIPINPGASFYFEVYIRTVGLDAPARARIMFVNTRGETVGEGPIIPTVTGDQDWQRLSTSFTCPNNAAGAQIVLSVDAGKNGVAFFDDVVFAEKLPTKKAL